MRLRTGAGPTVGRLPTSAQRRDGPASTSKQLHKRRKAPHQPDTIDIAALATQSVPAPLLSTAFSRMSSKRGRRAAALRQVFERSTARYLHLYRTSGRRRMKGNVLCRRQLSSFIPNTLLAVTPAKIGIQAKCPEKLPNSFCPILFH